MTERVSVDGQEVWIVVEPVSVHRDNQQIIPTEYFMAYYNRREPSGDPGELFRDSNGRPRLFLSPVEALEYACENLPGMTAGHTVS
jgi:hypothetical protein